MRCGTSDEAESSKLFATEADICAAFLASIDSVKQTALL